MTVELIQLPKTLPADFSFEIEEYQMAAMGFVRWNRWNVAWQQAKDELLARGYEIFESRDNAASSYKFRCRIR